MSSSHSKQDNAIDSSLEKTQAGYACAQPDIKQSHAYTFLNAPKNKEDIGEIGHYQISDTLGEGGMGVVFKALDSQLHRIVALKVMKPELSSQANAKSRFLHEARSMAAIHSDNVAVIHQVGEQNDTPYLAMEFLKGQSMAQWLKTHKNTSAETIVKWGMQICKGLAAAHKENLIHRDIKPANLWIEEPDERIKILDFGLAFASDSNDKLTQTGYILGTLEYMSPEQIESGKVSAQSDLFSLGCVLYQLASNHSPFSAASQLSILNNLASLTPLPLRQIRKDIPASLSILIAQLLSKTVDKRPASADEVYLRLKKTSNELSSVQADSTAKAQHSPPLKKHSKPIKKTRHTKTPIGKKLFIAVVAILLLIIFFAQYNKKAQLEPLNQTKQIIKPDRPPLDTQWEINDTQDDNIEEEFIEPDYTLEDSTEVDALSIEDSIEEPIEVPEPVLYTPIRPPPPSPWEYAPPPPPRGYQPPPPRGNKPPPRRGRPPPPGRGRPPPR